MTVRLSLCAVLLLATACDDAEKKQYEAKRAQQAQRLASLQSRFKTVQAAWPNVAATPERPCADDAVLAEAPTQAARVVVTVSWPWLVQHASGRSGEWVDGKPGHWALERLDPSDTATLNAAWEALDARPYLGVYRLGAQREGKVIDPATMTRGATMGTYVIFDQQKARALCWFPVVAIASDEVTYRAKSGESEAMLKEKAALSVGADLVMKTEAAIRAALEAHSKALTLPMKLSEKP